MWSGCEVQQRQLREPDLDYRTSTCCNNRHPPQGIYTALPTPFHKTQAGKMARQCTRSSCKTITSAPECARRPQRLQWQATAHCRRRSLSEEDQPVASSISPFTPSLPLCRPFAPAHEPSACSTPSTRARRGSISPRRRLSAACHRVCV